MHSAPSCTPSASRGADVDPETTAAAPAPVGSPFESANGLTSRREMFCRHYVACGNAAEAARQAGYADDNARQQGYRLLDDSAIRARIRELWHHAEAARTGDRDILIAKSERLFEEAMKDRSFNAAARALSLQIGLAGFLAPTREREEVIPGRAGPVARLEMRKAEEADLAAQGPPAPDAEDPASATDTDELSNPEGGEDGDADAPATAAPSGAAGPAPGGSTAMAGERAEPPCDTEVPPPLPDAPLDPWAEAVRIDRERELAAMESRIAASRRRGQRTRDAELEAEARLEARVA